MSRLAAWDNLDDRRELWGLLAGLDPGTRWEFIRFCCRGCRVGNKSPRLWLNVRDVERMNEARRSPGGAADRQITNQAYGFLFTMRTQYFLDLEAVAGVLVELVRGRITLGQLTRLVFPPDDGGATLSPPPGA